jgi:hypothetical protein
VADDGRVAGHYRRYYDVIARLLEVLAQPEYRDYCLADNDKQRELIALFADPGASREKKDEHLGAFEFLVFCKLNAMYYGGEDPHELLSLLLDQATCRARDAMPPSVRDAAKNLKRYKSEEDEGWPNEIWLCKENDENLEIVHVRRSLDEMADQLMLLLRLYYIVLNLDLAVQLQSAWGRSPAVDLIERINHVLGNLGLAKLCVHRREACCKEDAWDFCIEQWLFSVYDDTQDCEHSSREGIGYGT